MDIISFNEASTANGRIESFIENPDSTSGIVTVPKVIASGETITIPAGRIAVLPNVQVDGTLNIDGEVFVPSGATFGDLESQIALKADTSYVNNKYSGFKNFIINGDMRVAQRGNGPFNTNGYNIDQWFSFISSTTSNVTRIWNDTGSNANPYVQCHIGVGSDILTFGQRLEHPHKFSGKTLTLSMKLFNSDYNPYTRTTVPYEIAINHVGGYTLLFAGNLGFSSTSRVSVTFTVPDLSGYTLNASSFLEIRPVNIINMGHTGTFGITDVQLEEGSVATPFEHRPYGLELSLCQRYFEVVEGNIGGYGTAGQQLFATKPFAQTKRVTPSMTVLSLTGNNVNGAAVTVNGSIAQYGVYNAKIVNTGEGNYVYTVHASAEL